MDSIPEFSAQVLSLRRAFLPSPSPPVWKVADGESPSACGGWRAVIIEGEVDDEHAGAPGVERDVERPLATREKSRTG